MNSAIFKENEASSAWPEYTMNQKIDHQKFQKYPKFPVIDMSLRMWYLFSQQYGSNQNTLKKKTRFLVKKIRISHKVISIVHFYC